LFNCLIVYVLQVQWYM